MVRLEGLKGVLSHSDPVQRTSASGVVVAPGHIGTIYQATNAVYLGRARPRSLHLLPDGTVFSERTIQKIRAAERGWRAGVQKLESYGCAPLPTEGERLEWLRQALSVCRRLRHGGNHRYAWALHKGDRKRLPAGIAYPKMNIVQGVLA